MSAVCAASTFVGVDVVSRLGYGAAKLPVHVSTAVICGDQIEGGLNKRSSTATSGR